MSFKSLFVEDFSFIVNFFVRFGLFLNLVRVRKKRCKKFFLFSFLLSNGKKIYSGSVGREQENELVKLAQTDPEKFSEIYEIYFEKMYKFFYFRLRDQGEAEDMTSEVFEKAFKKLNTFEDKGLPFGAWIFRIARNSLIDHLRKHEKARVESLDEVLPAEEPGKDFDLCSIDRKILKEKVWEVVQKLPEKQQEIWSLKLTGMSHKEIAKAIGTTENNVNVIMHRSLSKLKKLLSHLKVSL